MEKARTFGANAKKIRGQLWVLCKETLKTGDFSEKTPSRRTFREDVNENLNISEGDVSEGRIAVYINPGGCISIRCSEGAAVSKTGLDIDLSVASAGDQHGHLAKAAVQIQLTEFGKLPAAGEIQGQIAKTYFCLSAGQQGGVDQMALAAEGNRTGKGIFFTMKTVFD